MDVADLFTIVYGSLYITIVLYISVYCWLELENKLIFSIRKITVEYKKIISSQSPKGQRDYGSSLTSMDNKTPYPFNVSEELQHYMGSSITSGHKQSLGNSFLRPIPDKYYETFIKPFDIYDEEDAEIIATTDAEDEEHDQLAVSTTTSKVVRLASPTAGKTDSDSEDTASNEREFTFAVKFFYWVWVTWNMSSIYGLLIIHIWDLGTDGAVMIKWYTDGVNADPKWRSANGDIDLFVLFISSIFFILLYRVVASLMIYKLTLSPLRVLSQLLFDSEIFRSIFISFKLRLSEPGYIQTWLQKLEATFESFPQAILQLAYMARVDEHKSDNKLVIISIVLSLVTMAERFERDDKLYFPYSMYYITKETAPYISFPYIVRFCWRLFEVSCRTFVFVLLWATLGGYVLCVVFVIECILIGYGAYRDGKYDFLSYFVGVPLRYLKEKRTWSLTAMRFVEHCVFLAVIWANVCVDFACEESLGCYSFETVRHRLWLTPSGEVSFGMGLLISTTIMTPLTPLLYGVIWKWYIVKDVSRLTATQERDIWVVTRTGDIRGLREMIEFGVNPDLRNRKNETLLHVYLRGYIKYNQEFVNVLSENSRFYMGAMTAPGRQTILHAAVSHVAPSPRAIKYLLDYGIRSGERIIQINDTDSDGRTALMYYLGGDPSAYNSGDNSDDFPRDADASILRIMSNFRYELRPEIRDKNGNCIIHYAAMNRQMSDDNIEIVIEIYLNSVNRLYADKMDEIDKSGPGGAETRTHLVDVDSPTTPGGDQHLYNLTGAEQIQMYKAAHAGDAHKESNKWEYVVDSVDVKNRFHQTPFMLYMAYNASVSNSMINLFMEHNVDPLVRDGFHNSIFHWAVRNPAINDENGLDALRFICQQLEAKHFGSITDAFEANAKNESILHTYFAAENEEFNRDIVNLFLDYNVDINTCDLKGNTCLHYAAANTHMDQDFFLFLLTKISSSHLGTKNSDKQTPIDVYKAVHSEQQYAQLTTQIDNNHQYHYHL